MDLLEESFTADRTQKQRLLVAFVPDVLVQARLIFVTSAASRTFIGATQHLVAEMVLSPDQT